MQKSRDPLVPALLVLPIPTECSDVGVIPSYDVAPTVVHSRTMTPRSVSCEQRDQRQHSADHTHNHQGHPDVVDIETMLIRSDGHCKVENRTDRKCDDACPNPPAIVLPS
jgi:hypothetical protein